MVTSVRLYALRLVDSPVKKDRWRKRIGDFIARVFQLGCGPHRKVGSAGKWKVGIESHNQVLKDRDASRKNSGQNAPSQGIIQKYESQERNP